MGKDCALTECWFWWTKTMLPDRLELNLYRYKIHSVTLLILYSCSKEILPHSQQRCKLTTHTNDTTPDTNNS